MQTQIFDRKTRLREAFGQWTTEVESVIHVPDKKEKEVLRQRLKRAKRNDDFAALQNRVANLANEVATISLQNQSLVQDLAFPA